MRNVGKQEKNFSRFKSGHASALYDLLESERPFLYDYLMRMTSQVSRSADSINEVYESLSEEVISVIESARDLRLVLYTTARRFNSDIWNAETSRLINAAVLAESFLMNSAKSAGEDVSPSKPFCSR